MSNAEEMQKHAGKTIAEVIDLRAFEDPEEAALRPAPWWDPDGFVIKFTDGTHVTVSADSGQGVGYVIVE
jgi:hypothetical protein